MEPIGVVARSNEQRGCGGGTDAVAVEQRRSRGVDQPGGDAGELSTPAQVRFPVKPTRHRSSAHTKIR